MPAAAPKIIVMNKSRFQDACALLCGDVSFCGSCIEKYAHPCTEKRAADCLLVVLADDSLIRLLRDSKSSADP